MEVFNIKPDFLVNEQIRFTEIQLIGDDGEKLGIMSSKDAQNLALEQDLDLVLVAPTGKPPVCKILDYGKYRFEMVKKEKESKKKQKVVDIKEIRLSPNIDLHDLEVKAKNANKFLEEGDKVKVSLRFRGREMSFIENGKVILKDFVALIQNGIVEKEVKLEGRSLTTVLTPKQK